MRRERHRRASLRRQIGNSRAVGEYPPVRRLPTGKRPACLVETVRRKRRLLAVFQIETRHAPAGPASLERNRIPVRLPDRAQRHRRVRLRRQIRYRLAIREQTPVVCRPTGKPVAVAHVAVRLQSLRLAVHEGLRIHAPVSASRIEADFVSMRLPQCVKRHRATLVRYRCFIRIVRIGRVSLKPPPGELVSLARKTARRQMLDNRKIVRLSFLRNRIHIPIAAVRLEHDAVAQLFPNSLEPHRRIPLEHATCLRSYPQRISVAQASIRRLVRPSAESISPASKDVGRENLRPSVQELLRSHVTLAAVAVELHRHPIRRIVPHVVYIYYRPVRSLVARHEEVGAFRREAHSLFLPFAIRVRYEVRHGTIPLLERKRRRILSLFPDRAPAED